MYRMPETVPMSSTIRNTCSVIFIVLKDYPCLSLSMHADEQTNQNIKGNKLPVLKYFTIKPRLINNR